ncbi:protein of unknown function [Ruaniaceae bacterium KH17]|nr:protein of unknown function [Ruaniaceae bacterium KH17]
MTALATVGTCSVTACSYNDGGCTAYAVTIGGADSATCGTFISLDARGGLPVASSHVGACKHMECVHNEDLMCTAQAIEVGDNATCLTYAVK